MANRLKSLSAFNTKRGSRTKSGSGAKFGNIETTIDGIKFDSKKEAARYQELKTLQRAGKISDLKVQPRFVLVKGVKFSGDKRAKPDIRYTADFSYINEQGEYIVEDVKSETTKKKTDYKMRRHMMLAFHGIEVKET